jgi:hypothetical protein
MSTVNVPDELLSRAQILADTEGISLEAFVVRCVDDAVTHMEAAEAELDAADDAATKKPAVPAGSAYAAVLNRQDGVGVSVTFEPDPPKAPTAYRRPMVYQSKSQVRRELKQFEQPIPHPSESAQAVLEGLRYSHI